MAAPVSGPPQTRRPAASGVRQVAVALGVAAALHPLLVLVVSAFTPRMTSGPWSPLPLALGSLLAVVVAVGLPGLGAALAAGGRRVGAGLWVLVAFGVPAAPDAVAQLLSGAPLLLTLGGLLRAGAAVAALAALAAAAPLSPVWRLDRPRVLAAAGFALGALVAVTLGRPPLPAAAAAVVIAGVGGLLAVGFGVLVLRLADDVHVAAVAGVAGVMLLVSVIVAAAAAAAGAPLLGGVHQIGLRELLDATAGLLLLAGAILAVGSSDVPGEGRTAGVSSATAP